MIINNALKYCESRSLREGNNALHDKVKRFLDFFETPHGKALSAILESMALYPDNIDDSAKYHPVDAQAVKDVSAYIGSGLKDLLRPSLDLQINQLLDKIKVAVEDEDHEMANSLDSQLKEMVLKFIAESNSDCSDIAGKALHGMGFKKW